MKLRARFQDEDFDFGEVVDADITTTPDGFIKFQAAAEAGGRITIIYDTLERFCSDWEDVPEEPEEPEGPEEPEEPKEYWYMDYDGTVKCLQYLGYSWQEEMKAIGNYFESEGEAKRALEKLKAWQRLKNLGTEILGWEIRDMPTGGSWQTVNVKLNVKARKEPMELLDLLFEGEE